MIWCRCNAHLVESDDDQTPDETCCACRDKPLRAARLRWYAARAEKGAAQRVPAVAPLMSICPTTMADSRGGVKFQKAERPGLLRGVWPVAFAAHLRHAGRIAMTMPDAHRNVKHNTPPRAAGGSDVSSRLAP